MAQPGLLLDNRYRLDDRIAAGGMGEVWRGSDLLLDRQVAVKLMRPGYADDAEGLARFRAEARYAGSLAHRNIAIVYDYWEGDPPGQPYLVMELVEGPSLAGILERGPIGIPATLDVVAQTAAGLQAAHAAGVVHRDIKPANLLVNRDGQIKISDFGIARMDSSAALTSTGQVIGTVAYMAPERVTGQSATAATDLYALGVVAYECLTGKRPFEGEPLAVALAHQQQGLPPLPSSVPAGIARLVADLTAKNPRSRPASAGEVAVRAQRLRAEITGQAGGLLAVAAGQAGEDWLSPGAGGVGESSGGAPYPGTRAYPAGQTRPDGVAFPGGMAPAGGTPFPADRTAANPGDRTATYAGDRTAGFPGGETLAGGGILAGGGTLPGEGSPPGDWERRGRRRKLLLGAGAAAAVVLVAVIAWLAFATGGNQPRPRLPQAVRHSSRPARPSTRPTQAVTATTPPQQTATSAPASTPAPAPSTPSPSVTATPSATTPTTTPPATPTTPPATATPTTPAPAQGP